MREALRCDTIPEPYLAKGEKSWNNLLVTQPINSCSCTLDFIETVKNSQKGFFILFDAYHVPLNTSQPMTMPIAHWRITEANLAVCQTESAASYHGWALIMAMAMVLSWLLRWMEEEDRMCKILPRCSWGVSQGRGYTARLYHLPGCYAFATQAGRHRQAGSQIPTRTRILEVAATGSVGTNYILADL